MSQDIEWEYSDGRNLEELKLVKELGKYERLKEEIRIQSILSPNKKAKKLSKLQKYDLLLLTEMLDDIDSIVLLEKIVSVHTVYYTDRSLEKEEKLKLFFKKKQARFLIEEEFERFVFEIPKSFFQGQFGSKMLLKNVSLAPNLSPKINVIYDGNQGIYFSGYFGLDFIPVATWRQELGLIKGRPFELWPEFTHEVDCQIQMTVLLMPKNQQATVAKSWVFTEEDMKKPVYIDYDCDDAELAFSIALKGFGKAHLGCIHFRFSRLRFGHLALGDGRIVASNRQEINYFFSPGDLKPPLNVYFSGYSPAQGFEGYRMMERCGSPFLLISDPRLEGGAFYMGDEELEGKLKRLIQTCLHCLDFSSEELILTGISMGSFGALYYGAMLEPHSIIVGKPLINAGTVAENEKRNRPKGFGTSLDLLRMMTKEEEIEENIFQLNQKFWTIFRKANFKKTKIAVAYMVHDDYDKHAYTELVEHLKKKNVTVYGKGWEGRHNDNSDAISDWFIAQHQEILRKQFGRKI